MIKKENNYAYIDGANLHKGVDDLGWKLDYKLLTILSPSNHCSILLKRTDARITYLDWVKAKINKK